MVSIPYSAGAVCFDLFNTLVSVGQVPENIGRYTADILGVDRLQWNEACFGPAHEICRSTDSLETLQRLAHSIDPTIPLHIIEQAAVERQQRFDYALMNIPQQILDSLASIKKKGVQLALISNASSSEVVAWEHSPLAEWFDVVTFSWSSGIKKPDNAIYIETANKLGLPTKHCLFVGDGGSDEHFGAFAAGMKPVLISHFMQWEELHSKLKKYTEVLAGVTSDLDELCERWNDFGQLG